MSNSGTNDHLQLFVGNLPQTCTDNDLQDLFQQFGKVIFFLILGSSFIIRVKALTILKIKKLKSELGLEK